MQFRRFVALAVIAASVSSVRTDDVADAVGLVRLAWCRWFGPLAWFRWLGLVGLVWLVCRR